MRQFLGSTYWPRWHLASVYAVAVEMFGPWVAEKAPFSAVGLGADGVDGCLKHSRIDARRIALKMLRSSSACRDLTGSSSGRTRS